VIPADSLRAALDSVFRSPAYDWVAAPASVAAARRWWERLVEWLASFERGSPTLFRAMVVVLVAILLAVLAHAAWVTWRVLRGAAPAARGGAAPPRTPRRDREWYLREADRLAEQGRWRQAMPLAFIALSLRLDEIGLLRFEPSKTPGEIAREARLADGDRARLRALVGTLYRCAFAGEACGADEWRPWRAAVAGEWHAAAG
jgi:hypothetical protein